MSWRVVSLAVWGLLVLGAIALEAWSVVSHGRVASIGALWRWLVASRARRWVVLVGWMWLGWHLFAR